MITQKDIYRLDHLPEGYTDYTVSSFEPLGILEGLGADAAFYWYATGSYCGAGNMIILVGDAWYLCDLNHCSCYGPEDGVKLDSTAYLSFTKLLEACTREHQDNVLPLIELIKEVGYGPKPDTFDIGIGNIL